MDILIECSIFHIPLPLILLLILFVVSFYFIWHWLLSRVICHPLNRKFVAAIGSLVSALIAFILLVFVLFAFESYYPSRSFEPKGWSLHPSKRYEMSDDIIEQRLLLGKTKDQVIQLLGPPSASNSSELLYELGRKPEFMNSDMEQLHLIIQNNTVVEIYQTREPRSFL